MRDSRSIFKMISALVICGIAFPAYSQTSLEEIVVTARKREETLKEIPLSISAFSSSDIERKGLQTLADIQFSAPGMQ